MNPNCDGFVYQTLLIVTAAEVGVALSGGIVAVVVHCRFDSAVILLCVERSSQWPL